MRVLVAAALCLTGAPPASADRGFSRRAFIQRLSRVGVTTEVYGSEGWERVGTGWSEAHVRATLGPPDDVVTWRDPHPSSDLLPEEGWRALRYGTRGHLSFPLLGTVVLDNEDRVVEVRGDYKLPEPR